MRLVRWLPSDTVWLVTNRCEQEQFLLEPSFEKNGIIGGWFARALERYGDGIKVFCFTFMSNHFHILLEDTKGQLPRVMWYFQTNLAKEINLMLERPTGRVFGRRYDAKQISGEGPFLKRYAYVLGNPVKDGLVERSSHWPGLSSLAATLSGEPMHFRLLDRTAFHNASRSGKPVKREDFIKTHTIRLAVPPMLAGLDEERRREMVEQLVAGFEEVHVQGRAADGKGFLGEEKIACSRETDRPRSSSFRRRRSVVAQTREEEEEIMDSWRQVTDFYRATFGGFRKASLLGRVFHGEWPLWTCPPGCLEPVGYRGK